MSQAEADILFGNHVRNVDRCAADNGTADSIPKCADMPRVASLALCPRRHAPLS
jgi:hypothetical protein